MSSESGLRNTDYITYEATLILSIVVVKMLHQVEIDLLLARTNASREKTYTYKHLENTTSLGIR